MLYREIMAVCSQIHTKHINTVCGHNVELLNVKLAVHIVTTGLQNVKGYKICCLRILPIMGFCCDNVDFFIRNDQLTSLAALMSLLKAVAIYCEVRLFVPHNAY